MNKALFREKSGNVDVQKDKEYIILKILNFGDVDDYEEMQKQYSKQEILSCIKEKYFNLDDLTRNYINHKWDLSLPLTGQRNEIIS
jgi:hypothetical protein